MVRSTIIVRASDALPMAATVDDEQVCEDSSEYVASERLNFGLSPTDRNCSPRAQTTGQTDISADNTKCGAPLFHRKWAIYTTVRVFPLCSRPCPLIHSVPCRSYLIADNVVYLVIADKSYPRKLAFSYLDELSKEFALSYGAKVDTVRKPYAFVGFGRSYTMFISYYRTVYHWQIRYIHGKDNEIISRYPERQRRRV